MAILAGVTIVAVWLNTKTALQDAIIGETELLSLGAAIYTVSAFAVSAIAADGGRRLGDHLAANVFGAAAPQTIRDVTQLVRSAGRVHALELPETIEDIDEYDPVDEATKAALAGETLLFSRRLSQADLRERLVERLERDYGIGHVDVDLSEKGTVEYLAVGSRPAGIGPTLSPGSVAVAIPADPAPDATPGDAVRIWAVDEDGSSRRVASGELRGTAEDVATVAVDADEVRALEPDRPYRLVTLPGSPDASREFVSILRAADEAVTALSIGSSEYAALEGETVGSLPVHVLAIERTARASAGGDDGREIVAFPDEGVRLEEGDVAYVLGRPEALRRLSER